MKALLVVLGIMATAVVTLVTFLMWVGHAWNKRP